MAAPPLHDAHLALGAAPIEVDGRTVPRHYGDSAAEYAAVSQAAGIVDRSDLAVVRLWGRDPAKMLHGLITNDLLSAPDERAVYAAVLTAKGRMVADVRALRRRAPAGEEVRVLTAAAALPGLSEHLRKFVPPLFARWSDASSQLGVIGIYGPVARAVVGSALGAELPALAEDEVFDARLGDQPVAAIGTAYAGGEGYDLLAATEALPALWDALVAHGSAHGARPVGHAALEVLRIEAGSPRYGVDLTEDTIPTEAYEPLGAMARAVSFTKGCYTGQEVIVRIAHRGHVNRYLRGLLLGEAPTPAAGTALVHPGTEKPVGRTTSGAHSPRLAQTIALGYVRREVEPGTLLRLGDGAGPEARVVALPFR